MPPKHKAGGCGCCGCWGCGTAPDTVAAVAEVVSNPCCARPSGTFTVGAASSSSIISNANYSYNLPSHAMTYNSGITYPCTWSWTYTGDSDVCCNSDDSYQLPCSTSANAKAYAVCESNQTYQSSFGSWIPLGMDHVVLQSPVVHALWQKTTMQIAVVIWYPYWVVQCAGGTGGGSRTDFYDEYVATVSCGALPSTINFTGRYVGGVKMTAPYAFTYGTDSSGNPYTYSMCDPIASVDLTYA